MKNSGLVATALGARLGYALVGNSWSMSGSPSGGLTDITFPFKMNDAAHTSGYYFAQQFNFENVDEVGYTGLQPRADSNGQSIVHGVFSSFQSGTTTDHPNCSDGADGGAGVSCAVEVPGSYDSVYNLVVENTGGTTWSGTMVEVSSGKSTEVGSWTLPSGAGGIKSSQVGFVEYYPWNSGTHSCGDLPKVEVTFYNPTSETSGSGSGSVGKPYEYGDCVGEVDFSTTSVSGGYDIKVGF